MDVTLSISSDDLVDEDLQALALDLCTTLNQETDVNAALPEGDSGPGTKGAEIEIGTVVLTFLSSGSAVALFNVLKSYIERDSSIDMEFEREDGRKLKIRTQNVPTEEMDRNFERAREFFKEP